jgi:hypothetical protein
MKVQRLLWRLDLELSTDGGNASVKTKTALAGGFGFVG